MAMNTRSVTACVLCLMVASAQSRIKLEIPPNFRPRALTSLPPADGRSRSDQPLAMRTGLSLRLLAVAILAMTIPDADVEDSTVISEADEGPMTGFGNGALSDVGLLVDPAERLR